MNVQEYTDSVWHIINDLKKWRAASKSPFFFSEIVDLQGNQYVNLVQEGGGMLGIALAGFTYVMEQMGIRFLGLGGTSAGSINAFLLATLGGPQAKKSERILKYLTQKKFIEFMDGGSDAQALIKAIGSESKVNLRKFNPKLLWNLKDIFNKQGINPGINFEQWLDELLIRSSFQDQLLEQKHYENEIDIKVWDYDELIDWIHSQILNLKPVDDYGIKLEALNDQQLEWTSRKVFADVIKKAGFFDQEQSRTLTLDGVIDQAVQLMHYLEKQMNLRLVQTLCFDLNSIKGSLPDFQIRSYNKDGTSETTAVTKLQLEKIRQYNQLALISAELTTQTKVIFPQMADLYYKNVMHVSPTKFVRSSMSVPVLFEPVKISLEWIDPNNAELLETMRTRWNDEVKFKGELPKEVVLVDGGIMSNFPIDVFDELTKQDEEDNPNKDYSTLDLKPTTIGVKLGIDRKTAAKSEGILSLIGLCFNNARTVRDFEYIHKNPEFSNETIAYIDTDDFNWLNFDMSETEMKKLFLKGAEAASQFLKDFDYGRYKRSLEKKKNRINKGQLISANINFPYYVFLYDSEYPISDERNKDYKVRCQLPEDTSTFIPIADQENTIRYTVLNNSNDSWNFQIGPKDFQKLLELQQPYSRPIIDKLIKHYQLPEHVDQVFPLANEQFRVQYNTKLNPTNYQVKVVAEDVYKELVNAVKLVDALDHDIKNLAMRYTLMQNMWDLDKYYIAQFNVLWLMERISTDPYDPNDKQLMEAIRFGGGESTVVKHKDELQTVISKGVEYSLVIIRTSAEEINRDKLDMLEQYKKENKQIEQPKMICFARNATADWCTVNLIRVYHSRIDLLHKVMDVFHRRIYINPEFRQ